MESHTPQEKTTYNAPIQDMVNQTRKDSTTGPLIGSIIIIIIMVVGGLYFWGTVVVSQKNQIQSTILEEQAQADNEIKSITSQSSDDSIGSIEADLNATILEDFDSELDSIDIEYQ